MKSKSVLDFIAKKLKSVDQAEIDEFEEVLSDPPPGATYLFTLPPDAQAMYFLGETKGQDEFDEEGNCISLAPTLYSALCALFYVYLRHWVHSINPNVRWVGVFSNYDVMIVPTQEDAEFNFDDNEEEITPNEMLLVSDSPSSSIH